LEDKLADQINLDSPEFAVPEANRIVVNNYPSQMMPIPASRMFEIKKALATYKQNFGSDAPAYDASQGDGGASLPGVPQNILERAFQLQVEHGTAYDMPYGTDLFRKVTAEHYWQLDSSSGWGPNNIIFVQGGRDGLNKAYSAMIALGYGNVGDVLVVSRVPWVSYNWGPYGLGLNVVYAPGRPENGWSYTPESIKLTAEYVKSQGRNIAGIVITSPDNPTGRTISVDEQVALAKSALENGIAFVLFDWIYHWVTDGGHNDINAVLKAFTAEERKRLIFLDGITKSLGGSNVRSAHLVADEAVVKYVNTVASHGIVPSFYAQAVAIAAYEMGFEKAAASIIEPTRESRRILREALAANGIPHIMGDGYYAFIDCSEYIQAAGYPDSEALLTHLGENHGLAVVPGIYFSQAGANWIRFSYAQSPAKTEGAVKRLFEGLNALKK